MRLAAFTRSLRRRFHSPANGPRRDRHTGGHAIRWRPRLEVLEDRAVPAAILRLATLGDSLTAAYPADAPWGAAGDHSWTEQLQLLRDKKIDIRNVAVVGATSDDVLASQAPVVAGLVAHHQVDYASIIVGANDVFTHLPTLVVSGPQAFIQSFVTDVTTNIAKTVAVLRAAGDVGVVIANVPDVTVTPAYQVFVSQTFGAFAPQVILATATAITQANQRIETFAAAGHMPVVDLFGLTHLATTGVTVGGVRVTNLFSPDFFHPNTIFQGILGNTVLEALHDAYHVPLQPLWLSDQDILAEAGFTQFRNRPRTYFDVSPFVFFQQAEVLVG